MLVPQAPNTLYTKAKKRILVTTIAICYCAQISCMTTQTNMHCLTLQQFKVQWRALKDMENKGDPEGPKLREGGRILKWTKTSKLHLHVVLMFGISPLHTPSANRSMSHIRH